MDDKSKPRKQSGPITEESLRAVLKEQGIDNLDDLIKHTVQQANAAQQDDEEGGSRASLTRVGGTTSARPVYGGLQTEWTAVYDSDKWGLIMR